MPRAKRKLPPPDTIWAIPDNLWPAVEAILDEYYPPAATGRPRRSLRRVMDGVIYRMRTGCQWNRLPAEFGSDTTVHRWFQRFVADGVFEELWAVLVAACDELGGVSWRWQASGSGTRPPGARPGIWRGIRIDSPVWWPRTGYPRCG
jgi:putative transposase